MQNLAAMDRYRFTKVGYADEEAELSILGRVTPKLPENVRKEWFGLLIRSANCFLVKTEKMVSSASPCPPGRWYVGQNCLLRSVVPQRP